MLASSRKRPTPSLTKARQEGEPRLPQAGPRLLHATGVQDQPEGATHDGYAQRHPDRSQHPEPRPADLATELEHDEDEAEGLQEADATSLSGHMTCSFDEVEVGGRQVGDDPSLPRMSKVA